MLETSLPLVGVRVLDIATFVAAPYCATILSEFGAEVIKVEEPGTGDPFRRFGTPTERPDSTLAWLSEARNKTSITLDLRSAEGAALFKRLVAVFRYRLRELPAGDAEKWGLGWEELSAVNPAAATRRTTDACSELARQSCGGSRRKAS
jgi:crotonobetainyl-CoA:carnitine CoA-transferase CaiB-like acyl-CoA transferase